MRGVRPAVVALGAAFGFLISWGGFADPDRIRDMLLLRDAYMYLMMATAVIVGFAGVRIARRRLGRAALTGTPLRWDTPRPERRHVVGSVIFGLGWAVSDACPGPIVAQLGQGVVWSVATFAGVVVGVVLALRRADRQEGVKGERPLAAANAPGLLASAPE